MKINKRTSTDVRFEVELNHCANLDFQGKLQENIAHRKELGS